MPNRPVVVYPHPVLTTPTREVAAPDDDLQLLIDDMIATMHAEHGIGLAANQVGDTRRVCVVDLSGGEDADQIRVFINPKVIESGGSQSGEEGCLSFPGIYETITRPQRVTVQALDRKLQPIEVVATELYARCLVHECDHLDGVTFLQRMSPLKRRLVLRKIDKLQRDGEWPATVAR